MLLVCCMFVFEFPFRFGFVRIFRDLPIVSKTDNFLQEFLGAG